MNRRHFLTVLMAASGMAGCSHNASKPKSFILVHGAWHGAWCWADVKSYLEQTGHQVIAPTLKGLGSRASEMSAKIGLIDHIDEVVGAASSAVNTDIILVGHSYGGMVITGAADRLQDIVKTLVYLDAVVPENGATMISAHPSVTPQDSRATEASLKALAPDGVAMMALPPEAFGIPLNHPKYNWVKARVTPHPLKTWLDPINLENPSIADRIFIHATDPVLTGSTIHLFAAEAKSSTQWGYFELATGHDIMVTEPEKLAEILVGLVS